MIDHEPGRQTAPPHQDGQSRPARPHKRWRIVLLVVAVVAALLIVPPWISIGRYQNRIVQVLSRSLGRPVRISSVELRLLPWPGFVLTNLSVAEDPAYGSEPVLHANTVTANIRLLSLWQGRMDFSSVSVDEASLNVVRTAPGRWNLDPLFRTAAANAGSASGGKPHRFPYLEATNSRINFKNGAEKLPFSLMNTDLSFWQESPGEWRLRLRGQPARTDVVLDMGDTGIVRLEASVHRAPELRDMPLRMDLDWRQAQLGQLSRLLIGYDPGWRGDLTGELHLTGTPNAAQVTARLRASGVHRAEFAPASPLDFDANCSLVYHYSRRAIDNLVCNSPLGNGKLRVTGDVPGASAAPDLTVELDRISAGAGLDVLRTLRSGINPDLQATGLISGKLAYAPRASEIETRERKDRRVRQHESLQGPLTGSLTLDGFTLSGGALSQPIRVSHTVFEPAVNAAARQTPGPEVLAGSMAIPAGGTAPLNVNLKLALYGYEAGIHGQASLARARELAQMAGVGGAAVLQGLAGEPLTASLLAEGPWLSSEEITPGATPQEQPARPTDGPEPSMFDRGLAPTGDSISGTITLRDASWQSDFLANHVQIAEATLHLGDGRLQWDPVAFAYGPVKGTATVHWDTNCGSEEPGASPCVLHFQAQFGTLDAGAVEAAFLGAQKKGTLFSDLIDRFHPSSALLWPAMEGTVRAESLSIGPVTLQRPSATVKIEDDHADFSALKGDILGGQAEADGSVHWARSDQAGPTYTVTALFDRLSAAAVGQLVEMHFSGGPIAGNGKLELGGFAEKDLATSAKGTLHFEWKNGKIAQNPSATKAGIPAHFSDWSGDGAIGNGAITLGINQMKAGGNTEKMEGTVTFAKPPKVRLEPVKTASQGAQQVSPLTPPARKNSAK